MGSARGWSRSVRATYADLVWNYALVNGRTAIGQPFRMLTAEGEHTREGLAVVVE